MRFVSCCITVACLLLAAAPASAEWFADVFAGKTFTDESDVTVHSGPGQSVFRDVEFEQSFERTWAYGGRFGRYFDAVPFLGLAVDVFNFSAPIGTQSTRVDGCVPSGGCGGGQGNPKRIDIDSLALSLDLMLRLPLLKTKAAPYGALQPYIAAGAPFFITTVTPRSTAQFRNHEDDTDYSFGYKVAGGLAFHIARNLMLFGEYRLSHVEVSVDELRAADGRHHARFKTELDTHSALVGLSARW
jgi:opacity protein-like surface antigen